MAVEFLTALNAAEQEGVVDRRLRTDGVVDDVGERGYSEYESESQEKNPHICFLPFLDFPFYKIKV